MILTNSFEDFRTVFARAEGGELNVGYLRNVNVTKLLIEAEN